MSISSSQPQILALRQRVEERFGKRLSVHGDFVALSEAIGQFLREHVSESTLERVGATLRAAIGPHRCVRLMCWPLTSDIPAGRHSARICAATEVVSPNFLPVGQSVPMICASVIVCVSAGCPIGCVKSAIWATIVLWQSVAKMPPCRRETLSDVCNSRSDFRF